MSLFRRRCPTHDRPQPLKIAEMEAETGIDPLAMERFWASEPSFADVYSRPDHIDCGRRSCNKRRKAAP